MAKIKKVNLKIKKEKTIYDLDNKLYYSGFCLTDNLNFAEFFVREKPNPKCISFEFNEKELLYRIGKEPSIIIDENSVRFDNFVINKIYFDYFINKYKNANFYFLSSFLKEPVLGLVGVLVGAVLIGLLKTKKET